MDIIHTKTDKRAATGKCSDVAVCLPQKKEQPEAALLLSHVVMASDAVKLAGLHATVSETTSQNRKGMDRCGQVSRNNSLLP